MLMKNITLLVTALIALGVVAGCGSKADNPPVMDKKFPGGNKPSDTEPAAGKPGVPPTGIGTNGPAVPPKPTG